MPWTLYRYILKDLTKVLALATGVLVVIIAVGAAIKPLCDGQLGPAGLVKFVLYSLPIMLGFALPYAAAFAGTMVFSRMAADNEIIACRGGGMSYRAILLPAFLLGFVLTLGLFYLSNWVVPTFYLMAEQQLENDMTRAVVNQIRNRQPVSLDNNKVVLYADAVDDTQKPPTIYDSSGQPAAIQPKQLIMLRGVAVGRVDEHGLVRSDSTAQRADVLLYRVHGQTWITMQLVNFMYSYADGTTLFFSPKSDILQFRLPNPFQERLHFLSWPELQALGEHPERFEDVAYKKQILVDAMATDRVISLMADSLEPAHGGAFKLQIPQGWLVVRAPQVRRYIDGLVLDATKTSRIIVEYYIGGLFTRRIDAVHADVKVEVTDPATEPQIVITLKNLRISDPRLKGLETERLSLQLPRANWPDPVVPDLSNRSATNLLEIVGDVPVAPAVAKAARQLEDSIGRLARQIMGRLHGRAASAVACLVVLMLGAMLSLLLRGSMPLIVYFWAFLLATVAVVLARSGENVASESSRLLSAGLVVVWSGNLLLAVVVVGLFARLRRN